MKYKDGNSDEWHEGWHEGWNDGYMAGERSPRGEVEKEQEIEELPTKGTYIACENLKDGERIFNERLKLNEVVRKLNSMDKQIKELKGVYERGIKG